MQQSRLLIACSQNCAYLRAETREKMTSIWNHEENIWVRNIFVNNLLNECGNWKLGNKHSLFPIELTIFKGCCPMKQVFPSALADGARKWSFPNILSCPVVVLFLQVYCLILHFLLPVLSVGSVLSPAVNRIADGLLCNKTPISSTREATEKQLLTKENVGIICLLRICWRLVYKSFCCFWLWLKCHMKLPSLAFNPFYLKIFRLRRVS